MFSCYNILDCWSNRLYLGYLRIRINYYWVIADIFTLIGNLPNNYGIKSYTLVIEKAPHAMNNIFSVLISPIFVLTVVP